MPFFSPVETDPRLLLCKRFPVLRRKSSLRLNTDGLRWATSTGFLDDNGAQTISPTVMFKARERTGCDQDSRSTSQLTPAAPCLPTLPPSSPTLPRLGKFHLYTFCLNFSVCSAPPVLNDRFSPHHTSYSEPPHLSLAATHIPQCPFSQSPQSSVVAATLLVPGKEMRQMDCKARKSCLMETAYSGSHGLGYGRNICSTFLLAQQSQACCLER